MSEWKLFHGSKERQVAPVLPPPPPPWRDFAKRRKAKEKGEDLRASRYVVRDEHIEIINAAILLRRPLLVRGLPGTGKSSLAYAVAQELGWGPVLRWSVNSRTTLHEGLYHYDAIGRLQELEAQARGGERLVEARAIDRFIRLGPLGTALLPSPHPRVLLIDEIDKADIDFPNDLLHVFEEGEFEIRELARGTGRTENFRVMPHAGTIDSDAVEIPEGRVQCTEFPFIIITSNDEREMPPPFLRRCLPLKIEPPSMEELRRIVESHLGTQSLTELDSLLERFLDQRDTGRNVLAVDQLLNAVFLVADGRLPGAAERASLLAALWSNLQG